MTASATAGDLYLSLRRLSDAESCCRRILVFDPGNIVAHRRLAKILTVSGRHDAARNYLALLRGGDFDTHELALLGNLEDAYENPELVKYFDVPLPDDRLLAAGAAHYALHQRETTDAARRFSQLAAADPQDIEVQVGWGAALVEVGTPLEFYNWHASLPPDAGEHPGVWTIRARWAQKSEERDVAIRCYWEALRRDPNHWLSNYQLALLLNARGERESSQAYQERAQRLKSLMDALYTLHMQPDRLNLMIEAARLCESLGRLWEACGWHQAA